MRTKKYEKNNPRKLVNIRKNTLQEIEQIYPNQNTYQKKIEKIIEEIKINRQKK